MGIVIEKEPEVGQKVCGKGKAKVNSTSKSKLKSKSKPKEEKRQPKVTLPKKEVD